MERAVKYRFKVFVDGEFDEPKFDKTVAKPTVEFPAGAFEEGRYYWLVLGTDAEGKEIVSGRTNSLQIAYDNAVNDLVIRNPRSGTRIASSSLRTSGEVQLGARLYINGKKTNLDDKGRFSE